MLEVFEAIGTPTVTIETNPKPIFIFGMITQPPSLTQKKTCKTLEINESLLPYIKYSASNKKV
jgi:hypothetical protein